MQQELKMLESAPPEIFAWPVDGALNHLRAYIKGPIGTAYAGGLFKLDLRIPERYPFEPPNVVFLTQIYHPNVDSRGHICLDILNMPPRGSWKPSFNVLTVLETLVQVLAEPNPDSGLGNEVAQEYKCNPLQFDNTARQWTRQLARCPSSLSLSSNCLTGSSQLEAESQSKENIVPANACNSDYLARTRSTECLHRLPEASSSDESSKSSPRSVFGLANEGSSNEDEPVSVRGAKQRAGRKRLFHEIEEEAGSDASTAMRRYLPNAPGNVQQRNNHGLV
ncbi:hypothetical protein CYMTET_6904 [Cymbomonas tetramitiformis]|uniref:UBC core domain-containing protein n=1 Tax=Cymbomonas tetramitiformis TaxID=36881 RepID=A0AAE0LHF1_9CHLO|nr:hypothetical protein CYMTET_6904 [Cymbomonas tetramitiformis]